MLMASNAGGLALGTRVGELGEQRRPLVVDESLLQVKRKSGSPGTARRWTSPPRAKRRSSLNHFFLARFPFEQ